jgi:flagellar M-ring protein FliF
MADGGQALTPSGGVPAQLNQLFGERALRQLGLIAGLAAAIAAGIALFVWAREPVYRPLYGKISQQDAPAVADALQAGNIPYKLEQSTGIILVPAAQVHDARLKLAAQGLPQSGGMGYELLQREQGFGTSQFMENARFNRALETELARSIGSLQGVESARVHLALPKQSVFIRERSQPSASILVSLFPGRTLSEGQVAAVVHLVASSVPDLPHERVTVVDERGRLLTRKDDGALGATAQQLEYKQQVEESYVRRIEALLAPMLGAGRVRAQVNAKLDFAVEESTQELFDPERSAVRSEQTSEQQLRDGRTGGIPGALTNQPPQAGVLAPDENVPDAQDNAIDVNRSATRNYEISKTIRHSRRPLGSLERLSLAVLVDHRDALDAEGKPVRQALTQEELDQIGLLVQQAVGFDAQRGDTINVISAPFQGAEEVAPVEVPLLEQPWVMEVGKLLAALIVGLVLLLAVVRPLIRGLLSPKPVPAPPVPVGGDEVLQLSADEMPRQLPSPGAELAQRQLTAAGAASTRPLSYEEVLTTARQVVSQEPAVAASVVKNWLGQDE